MKEGKTCQTCGRRIDWRKKWEDCWDEVRFCSHHCRRHKPCQIDRGLEVAILSLLRERKDGGTICPSDITRSFFDNEKWRNEMERTRRAARRLVAQGLISIFQHGRPVDPSTAKGPIRLRLRIDQTSPSR